MIQWSISHGFVAVAFFNPLTKRCFIEPFFMLQVTWKEWMPSPGQKHRDMCIVCRVHEKEANMIQVILHDLATGESTKNKQKSGVTVCVYV